MPLTHSHIQSFESRKSGCKSPCHKKVYDIFIRLFPEDDHGCETVEVKSVSNKFSGLSVGKVHGPEYVEKWFGGQEVSPSGSAQTPFPIQHDKSPRVFFTNNCSKSFASFFAGQCILQELGKITVRKAEQSSVG